MASRRIISSVSEDTYHRAMDVAKAEGISLSSLIAKALSIYLREHTTENESETITDNENASPTIGKRRRVSLDEETYVVLEGKARMLGLPITTYLRNLIRTKNLSVYFVQTEDINDFTDEVHKAIVALSSTVSMIKRMGQGKVFEQDIKVINQYSDEIVRLQKKIINHLYSTRRAAQQKLIKRYTETYEDFLS